MCGILHQEDALLHVVQVGQNLLERADVVDGAQIHLDDERVDVAALDAQPAQQFGRDGMLALEHGADAGQPRRSIGYDMNRH